MYDAILFDKDGVILDSGLNNFLWMDRVRMKTASRLGYSINKEESLKIVKARNTQEIEELIEEKGMTWKQLNYIENKVQDAKINMIRQGILRLFPDAEKLLNDLEVKTSLVTNAPERTTDFTLNYFSIRNQFDDVQSLKYDSLKHFIDHKKPHTYMLDSAIESLNAENPVMVGDSEADILAAQNAGIDSIFVQSYKEDTYTSPTHKVRNLEEIKHIIK